jgi:hypothetical protein
MLELYQKTKPMRIMGIKGEEVQAKEICNVFNKNNSRKFSKSQKELPIQVQEASRTPNRHDQHRTSPWHIILKTASTENRERILKAIREKKQKHIKVNPLK